MEWKEYFSNLSLVLINLVSPLKLCFTDILQICSSCTATFRSSNVTSSSSTVIQKPTLITSLSESYLDVLFITVCVHSLWLLYIKTHINDYAQHWLASKNNIRSIPISSLITATNSKTKIKCGSLMTTNHLKISVFKFPKCDTSLY
jgi:hypothetical protein